MRRLLLGLGVVFLGACGGRTGLLIPIDERPEIVDSSVPSEPETGPVALDAPPPPLDAPPPPLDAPPPPPPPRDAPIPPLDVTPSMPPGACADASMTLIYLVTVSNNLLSFDPATNQFRVIGTIDCPTAVLSVPAPNCAALTPTPFSMAVDRTGVAHVIYCDGELFRVSTANASCRPTNFVSRQSGFTAVFGMGFSQDTTDTEETLYVASNEDPLQVAGAMPRLATLSPTNLGLQIVAPFDPPLSEPELTGTGAGDLFGFYAIGDGKSSAIGQIDKASARVIAQSTLVGLERGNGWAFAFWGGDFYTFTAPQGDTVVTRFRPSDGSLVPVAFLSDTVVGAGVSTCAPQQ